MVPTYLRRAVLPGFALSLAVCLAASFAAAYAGVSETPAPPILPRVGGTVTLPPDAPQNAANAAQTRCMEDAPCWRWSKMGNLSRGVSVTRDAPRIGTRKVGGGRRDRVVAACEYAYAAMNGYLAPRTEPLKGDGYARRHGCDPRFYG